MLLLFIVYIILIYQFKYFIFYIPIFFSSRWGIHDGRIPGRHGDGLSGDHCHSAVMDLLARCGLITASCHTISRRVVAYRAKISQDDMAMRSPAGADVTGPRENARKWGKWSVKETLVHLKKVLTYIFRWITNSDLIPSLPSVSSLLVYVLLSRPRSMTRIFMHMY